MNNDSIRTQKQFIELLEKLTSEGKVYQVEKLSNRILEVIDNQLIDKEAEAIYTQFCKDYNIVLNSKLFFTLFRGYIYNLSSKEELDNLIKDDFYYSVLEFTENKSEVTMKSLCLHLFNLDSNKVKQELKTHIARCLTHIGFTSKRTSKGIKWINPVQPTQTTLSSESADISELQKNRETTQQTTLQSTQPTQQFINIEEEYKKVKQELLELKESNKITEDFAIRLNKENQQLKQENNKLLQTNLELSNKVTKLENKETTPVKEVADCPLNW